MGYVDTLRMDTNLFARYYERSVGAAKVYAHQGDRLIRGKVNGVPFEFPYPDCSKIAGQPFGDDRGLPVSVGILPDFDGWYVTVVMFAGDRDNRPEFREKVA